MQYACPSAYRRQLRSIRGRGACKTLSYALEHNISVKQQGLAAEQAAIELETAKWDRAPGLSGNASQNFSFGRGLAADNTYVNKNTASTGFSLGTSVNLFSGFRASETIRLRNLDLQSANAELLRAKNDISMNVAQAYMQILYNIEILGVAERQIAIDSLQLERLMHLLSNGKASEVEILQQRPPWSKTDSPLFRLKTIFLRHLLSLNCLNFLSRRF